MTKKREWENISFKIMMCMRENLRTIKKTVLVCTHLKMVLRSGLDFKTIKKLRKLLMKTIDMIK